MPSKQEQTDKTESKQEKTKEAGKILNGIVTSTKMDKTAVITVERRKIHPIYKKQFTVTNKYFADDPNNEAKDGDIVTIKECRPISKKKRWQIVKILGNSND